ncbi:MAG: hypothetical protein QGH15_04485 [Kiritimatiellia bacterium]|jgi:hypothetical protein|nr:hypothetical protein [Kiritimatiellia bacterium]
MKISIVILVIIGVGLTGQGVSQTATDETHGTSVRETELPDLSEKASLSKYLKYTALNNAGLDAQTEIPLRICGNDAANREEQMSYKHAKDAK